jgi:hypothetical protein
MGSRVSLLGVALAAACLVACAGSEMAPAKALPKTTPEGLVLQEHTRLRAVYLRPGAELDHYDKVKLLDCYVAFKKNWERDYNDQADFENRINHKDMDEIKKRLADDFRKVFTKELADKGGYPIVDAPGNDVLIVKPAIINLVVTAPDKMTPGMSETYVASAGQMTLYMELYDSVSSSLIARVIDPEADQGMGGFAMSNVVTNKAAEDQILHRWAEILRKHLAHVKK